MNGTVVTRISRKRPQGRCSNVFGEILTAGRRPDGRVDCERRLHFC